MIRTLLLDWSGTLADDLEVAFQATRATVLALGGADLDRTTFRSEFALPPEPFYAARVPAERLHEVEPRFAEAFAERYQSVSLREGVEELLHLCRARGLRVYVVTSLAEGPVRGVLERAGLAALVEEVIGSATDKRGPVGELVARAGLRADETLMAGDLPHDLLCARAHGLRAAAALYGYSPPERLLDLDPDDALESPGDLVQLLDLDRLATLPRPVATVGGLVLDPSGRALLVRTDKWRGSWGLPGGKIDYGETAEQAFRREVREETGLEVEGVELLGVYDSILSPEFERPAHFVLINYVARSDRAEVRPNYEIAEARWLTLDQARSLPLNTPTRRALSDAASAGHLVAGS